MENNLQKMSDVQQKTENECETVVASDDVKEQVINDDGGKAANVKKAKKKKPKKPSSKSI